MNCRLSPFVLLEILLYFILLYLTVGVEIMVYLDEGWGEAGFLHVLALISAVRLL